MEKLRKIPTRLILCIFELALGVVLLIDPVKFTSTVITAIGVLLCVLGALSAITYFRLDPEEAAISQELMKGLTLLAVGIFCIYRSDFFVRWFPVLTTLYGGVILFTGMAELQWTVDMVRLKRGVWQVSAVSALLSFILGVVVLANPFAVLKTLWTFTAISLIIIGVLNGASILFGRGERS